MPIMIREYQDRKFYYWESWIRLSVEIILKQIPGRELFTPAATMHNARHYWESQPH